MPAPRGRPTKCTPEIWEPFMALVRLGVPPKPAARLVGIGTKTLYRWQARGATDARGPYRDFVVELRKALAVFEGRLVMRIVRAARNGHWRAAKFYLEQRFPQRWAPRSVEPALPVVSVDVVHTVPSLVDLVGMTPRQLAELSGRAPIVATTEDDTPGSVSDG